MKKKWWIIPVVIVFIAAVLLGIFWESVAVRLAPKVFLTSALTNTAEKLQSRFEGSPLILLARNLDRNAQYDVQMDLEKSSELLGEVRYDMHVQTDGAAHQFQAEGMVTVKGSNLDLSVFCNEDFAALTSQTLLKGSYYGITFDTFDRDIQSSRLLTFLVGQNTIEEWKSSVSDLQKLMAKDFTFSVPEISQEDMQTLIGGILTLSPRVIKEELEVNGQTFDTFKIIFLAEEQDVLAAAEYLPANREWLEKITGLSVTFWIFEDSVIKLSVNASAGEDLYLLDLDLGTDAASDELVAYFSTPNEAVVISSNIKSTDSRYGEQLEITKWQEGIQSVHTLDYQWSEETGDMNIVLDGQELLLNLAQTEDGIRIQTENFDRIKNLILEKDEEVTGNSICTMHIRKGAEISTPEYKNMDQWSVNDLMVLLGSIGSLLGLNLG